jgi:hypothetical protein
MPLARATLLQKIKRILIKSAFLLDLYITKVYCLHPAYFTNPLINKGLANVELAIEIN